MEVVQPPPERHVLIVEDDPISRDILVAVLEEEGYTVSAAGDGRAGLSELRGHPTSVVVLDMAMPDMNGWAFLAAKAQIPEAAAVPVVVVSGSAPPRSTRGIFAWLEKPFAFDVLLRALKPWR
ncbi:MAG TPA: response regulator [Terriglobales bacterium]|nr:response regulator [Terriglobales bacterium]